VRAVYLNQPRFGVVLVASLALVSCQTITEELPTPVAASSTRTEGVPVIVIAMPTAAPTAATPRPTSAPTSPPPSSNDPQPGSCTGNCTTPVSVHAYVHGISCHYETVPGNFKFATDGPKECAVHLDATPKDASGRATDVIGEPHWTIDGGYRWAPSNNPYTPIVFGDGRAGEVTASVEIYGIQSNTFTFRFR
jgi:hypothetical protein